MSQDVSASILQHVRGLSASEQRRVLEFARALRASRTTGVTGKDLLRFAGNIPPEELKRMSAAIEEGCEQVHADEW